MDNWEKKRIEFVKRGQNDRIKFLENLTKTVLPVQLKRIQQNDKTVLKELVLPNWLEWELLYDWSNRYRALEKARECILCNELQESGMDFKEKFICENCFLRLKNI